MKTASSLTVIARPPVHPVGAGAKLDWHREEEKWKLRFPDDYKWLIENYGSGRFTDFFGISNPFHTPAGDIPHEEFVRLRLEGLRYTQEAIPEHAAALPHYPARGGLFPIGYTDNGGTIFWLTQGDPNHWQIVCMTNAYTNDFDRYELSLVAFLTQWLSKGISVPTLTPLGFYPLRKPVFVPTA